MTLIYHIRLLILSSYLQTGKICSLVSYLLEFILNSFLLLTFFCSHINICHQESPPPPKPFLHIGKQIFFQKRGKEKIGIIKPQGIKKVRKTGFNGLDLKKLYLIALLWRINVRGNVRDYIQFCCVMKEKLPSQKTVIKRKKDSRKKRIFNTIKIQSYIEIQLVCLSVSLFVSNKRQNG